MCCDPPASDTYCGIPAELALSCRTSCRVAYRDACLHDALAPLFHARFKTDLRSASARWCLGYLRILAGTSVPGPSSSSSRASGMPVLLEASSALPSVSRVGRLSGCGCSGPTAEAAWGVATWFAAHLCSAQARWCSVTWQRPGYIDEECFRQARVC